MNIDIKPYIPAFDGVDNAKIEWAETKCSSVKTTKSD